MMRERLPDRREAETFEITHRTHDGVEQTFIASGTTRATAWENIHNGAIRRVEPSDPENYIALGPITSPASGERDAATASDESDVGVIQSLRDNLTEAVVALMAAELVLSHTGHEGSLVLMQVRAVIAKSDGAK